MKRLLSILSLILATAATTIAQAQIQDTLDPLRTQSIQSRRNVSFYAADKFKLDALPRYVPEHKGITGTIRMWGSPYIREGRVMDYWEEGFHKHHPGVKFEYHLSDSLTALGGVYSGAGDIGVGPKLTWNDFSAFIHTFSYDPLEFEAATGSYNVTGWNPAFGVYVNKDNPLSKISFDQLDGIFGAAREGGWVGFTWHPEFARGPEGNIRTWGEMGLTGEWKDKPINVYWLNLRYHMSETISNRLLKGSDKWNEKVKMYANKVLPDGRRTIASEQVMDEVVGDKYGITISTARWERAGTKGVAVSEGPAGPYVPMTLETVRDRSYPLHDVLYMYVNRDPKKAMDPKVKEFLRYVASREGQEDVVRDGKYLPLTAEVAREQIRKLD
jgi:phosphate transport system substrate-binding protein